MTHAITLARAVLLSDDYDATAADLALSVLATSTDPDDIATVRHLRHAAFAGADGEINLPQFAYSTFDDAVQRAPVRPVEQRYRLGLLVALAVLAGVVGTVAAWAVEAAMAGAFA